MPLVSVVLPSYNHEEFIAESIESVLDQDFDDFELIIVDDASTDTSRQVIQKYEVQDARIRVFVHEANRGMAETINDGIEAAKGKFIAVIASDDVWAKDKLTKQLAVIASDENLIVWSEGEVIDKNGQPTGKSFSEINGSVSRKKSGNIFQELLKGNYIFGTTLLFNKQNIEDIRYDARLTYLNDYKFALELARKHKFRYIADPLARYRIHGRNTLIGAGPDKTKRQYAEEVSVLQEALQRYKPEIPRATKVIIYSTLGFIYRELGENKDAISSFLQAIRYNPLSGANKYYLLSIFRLTRANLDVRIKRKKID